MKHSIIKLLGLVGGLVLFFVILLLPYSNGMVFYGAKIVLSHSSEDVLTALNLKKSSQLNKDNFLEVFKISSRIHVYLPKDFSISGAKGIKLSSQSKITLKKLFVKQANAIKSTIAIAVLMAIWWITEALPIPITSMLPLLLFPLLGIANPKTVSFPGFFNPFHPYMHYLIVLFLAGFTIAEAMKKWNLHKRISLYFLSKVPLSPEGIIFGFMFVTAVVSMFISNTATTAMMLPIGMGIVTATIKGNENNNFGKVLMLAIAYGSSIGGVATLIGTPPNVVLAGFADSLLGIKITFNSWLSIGLPITIVMLPLTFFVLIKIFPMKDLNVKGSKKLIKSELSEMGPLTRGEKNTLFVFVLTAFLWIFEKNIKEIFSLSWVNDAVVGVFAIVLFYVIPVNIKKWEFTLNWEVNKKLPWGTLLLFGGGLSLGSALDKTGTALYFASGLTFFKGLPLIAILLFVTFFMVFLTEITSNTASTNMMLPVLYSLGLSTSSNPFVLMTAGAVGASMAFMLPVATPPNALVFGSGYVEMKDMIKAGIILNFISITVITLFLCVKFIF